MPTPLRNEKVIAKLTKHLSKKSYTKRDSARIDPILESLKKLWHQYPDYRFGQIIFLLANTMHQEYGIEDMFFPEDELWIDTIQLNLDECSKNKKVEAVCNEIKQ